MSLLATAGIFNTLPSGGGGPTTDFVFTVQTTGSSETFTIPCDNFGTFDAIIDWGDGGGTSAITTYNDADLSHVYATADTYTITVSKNGAGGSWPNVKFGNNATMAAKVRTVTNLGDVGWTSLWEGFKGCSGMTSFTAGNTDTSALLYLYSCFNGCSGMTTCDVTGLDTSAVQQFEFMFESCSSLTSLDVTGFDTSAGKSFQGMFRYMSSMSGLDPSGFDLSAINTTFAFANFIESHSLSTSVYNALLNGFAGQVPVLANVTLNVGSSTYTAGSSPNGGDAKAVLTGSPYTWTISDGGTA